MVADRPFGLQRVIGDFHDEPAMWHSLHEWLAAWGVHPRVAGVLAAVLLALLVGTALRVLGGTHDLVKRQQRLASLRTWWLLFLGLAVVVCAGPHAVVAALALVSLAALAEYRRLVGDRIDGRLWWLAIAAVPIHYGLVAAACLGAVWTLIPVWILVAMLVRLVIGEEIQRFLETVGTVFLGLMLLTYFLSHAALLVTLPLVSSSEAAGPLGLLLYLVILTESNDIAQALWGRKFGRRALAPRISPHKTWEGFLLGAATTVVLAEALAPWLTPLGARGIRLGEFHLRLPGLAAAISGALIAVGGLFGDVTISAIKREVGVKDSGTLLPGMGGLLDRIDSLTFTGPLLFYFVYLLCA